MLPFPFDESFQAMQPLVVVGDTVLVKSPDPVSGLGLETAAGVEHRLSPIGCLESLWRNALQRLLRASRRRCSRRYRGGLLSWRRAPGVFHRIPEPTFRERDFSEASYSPRGPVAPEMNVDWPAKVSAAAQTIPGARSWCRPRCGCAVVSGSSANSRLVPAVGRS